MEWPTLEHVEAASREQLACWYRFLPSAETSERLEVQEREIKRFDDMGGFTPELSKRIGWGP